MAIDILERQILDALNNRSYFLALFAALALPDICGAIASENGQATRGKYISWYEKWVRPRLKERLIIDLAKSGFSGQIEMENPFTGEMCYYYRCGMLHQARADHPNLGYDRVLFVEPDAMKGKIHYATADNSLLIDLPSFCREVVEGSQLWRTNEPKTENYEENFSNTVQRYPNGYKRLIVGVAVIT